MNEEIRNLLDEQIKVELENLTYLNSGSKEKAEAIDDVVKLIQLGIEDTKIMCDIDDRRYDRNIEDAIKKRQFDEGVLDRHFKFGAEVGIAVLTLGFYAVWMNKGFKFEETGTFTSTVFKGLLGKFKPTK